MPALSDYNADSLAQTMARHGHNPANALRLLRQYWDNDGQLDLHGIDIAKAARRWLGEHLSQVHCRVLRRHQSADGTIKLLAGLANGGSVECVLMPAHRSDRAAACVSSQLGCAMRCDFCASTKDGFVRNLCVGEIVEQFLLLRRQARPAGRRISSLVFMGIGEPLLNLANVVSAIRLLGEPGLGCVGRRNITVSTMGIVPGIEALADAQLGVQLAVSLHAPDDETRSRLVPMNRRWNIAAVMEAARRYQARTGRPTNVEYCLIAGVNDGDDQALGLAELMRGFRAHVNVIPYNAIGAGLSAVVYERPSQARVRRFVGRLRDHGVVAHVRRSRGDDIAAACGQLRLQGSDVVQIPTIPADNRKC